MNFECPFCSSRKVTKLRMGVLKCARCGCMRAEKDFLQLSSQKCSNCHRRLPLGLLRSLKGSKYLCFSCWRKLETEVLEDLIWEKLKSRGEWNPSQRETYFLKDRKKK